MRIAHTMIRVNDLDQSIAFYTDVLGMDLLKKKEYPEGKFTLAFVGYGDLNNNPAIELTYNWDKNSYSKGDAFGHIAIEVSNVYEACDKIRARGGEVTREAGPMKGGQSVIAFVKDPSGYQIELVARQAG